MSKARDIADGAANINLLDDVTAGTVAASKVIAADSNKDVASFRNVTLTGELDAATLDVSGNADIDGVLETDGLSINGTTVTATAAELNILDGVTSTAAELNILDGVTATAAELNYSDGVTSNIQTQLDAKQALDANLTSFVGVFTLPTSDGSADQVLKTNGSGTLAFADAGGGGMHTLLATVTASGASTVDIGSSSLFTSTYDQYYIYSSNITSDTNDANIYARVSNGAFQTNGYIYAIEYITASSNSQNQRSTSENYLPILRTGLHSNSTVTASLRLYLNNPASTSLSKLLQWHCDSPSSFYGSADMGVNYGAGYWGTTTQAIQGLRLYLSSGNISGTFYLFGVAKS